MTSQTAATLEAPRTSAAMDKVLSAAYEGWRIPEPMLPSEWAEKNRWLKKSAIPGPYRNDNAPYLRGIMDIASRPGVNRLNIKKAAQVGVSEAARNLIAFWAQMDPDPMALTLPDREKGRKIVKRDILPLFKETQILSDLFDNVPREALIETISLDNGFNLDLMWSGSATSTSSFPERRVINEEVNKAKPWAGGEPDPVERTWQRTRTYGDLRFQMNISTPTTNEGTIDKLCDACHIKLFFQVPCPHCGGFQRLVFPQIKWNKYEGLESKTELAARIHRDRAVWYECKHCQEKITEDHKAAMIRAGKWITESGQVRDSAGNVFDDAEKIERWPRGSRIAMQISALYCLWTSWSEVVEEFLLAEGDIEKAMNFRTETLGEPFEFEVSRIQANIFSDKCRRAVLPEGVVPEWAWLLLLTIDTQPDHFYAALRAWGAGRKSQRVWHGKLLSFDELDRLIFHSTWPVESKQKNAPVMSISMALIDSGGTKDRFLPVSRTMQVYEYVLPRQSVIKAIKGASRPGPGLFWPMKNPLGKSEKHKDFESLQPWMVDTHQCNDFLADLILQGVPKEKDRSRAEPDLPEIWFLNQNNDSEYNHHMGAVHKIPEKIGANSIHVWKPIDKGDRWDFRDCFDSETEVLTRDGWIYFRQLPSDVELGTVNLTTDLLEYQRPLHIIKKSYKGPMMKFGGSSGQRLDLLVTPTHRMVIYRDIRRNRDIPFIRLASELHGRDKIKTSCKWSGNISGIPEKFRDCNPEALANFMGWYISEGYSSSYIAKSQPSSIKRRVIIYQKPTEKRNFIRETFQKLHWAYRETNRGFVITNKAVFELVHELGNQYIRYVPRWIKDLPPVCLAEFVRGAVDGDGWRDKCGSLLYSTVSKRLADDMQECFLKIGYATSMSCRFPRSYCIRGRRGTNCVPIYIVRAKIRKVAGLLNGAKKIIWKYVPYYGTVYCATVPNGTLIVRRNGKVVICGNCEAYQIAAAYMANVHQLPDKAQLAAMQQARIQARQQRKEKPDEDSGTDAWTPRPFSK